ncbi:MAG: phage tail protein [Chloroflexi bacterium]|nr:phage tail protein [Chloroflexota bacterium]
MNKLKLILVDPQPRLCAAFAKSFEGLPNVEIVNDYFERLPAFDCMVSAANSFGLMDGGVDLAIIRFFGKQLERRVQKHILEQFLGEQPVGASIIVETGHPEHPFVAHTPTMRIPMPISRTDNVYQAMWAMLLVVRQHNREQPQKIKTVACPGLGTATGEVPYSEAARQMAEAYRNFVNPPSAISWHFANKRQRKIRYGGDMGFLFPPKIQSEQI